MDGSFHQSRRGNQQVTTMHLCSKLIYFLVMPVCWGCSRAAPGPLPSSELTASVYSLADAAQNQRQFEKLFGGTPNS